MIGTLAVLAAAAWLQPPSCDALKALPLPHVTITAVEYVAAGAPPPSTLNGALVYPGRSPGFEAGWRIPTPGAPLNPLFTDMVRYVGRQDPNWDPMSFDLQTDLARALKKGGFIAANDPNLAKFKGTRPGRGAQTPMSRPLCPHPQVARYSGSGSTDDEKNFACVAP